MTFEEWYEETYSILANAVIRNVSFEKDVLQLMIKAAYEEVMKEVDFHLWYTTYEYDSDMATDNYHQYTAKGSDAMINDFIFYGTKLVVDSEGRHVTTKEFRRECITVSKKCGPCIYACFKAVPKMVDCDIDILLKVRQTIIRYVAQIAYESTMDQNDGRYTMAVQRYEEELSRLKDSRPTHIYPDLERRSREVRHA